MLTTHRQNVVFPRVNPRVNFYRNHGSVVWMQNNHCRPWPTWWWRDPAPWWQVAVPGDLRLDRWPSRPLRIAGVQGAEPEEACGGVHPAPGARVIVGVTAVVVVAQTLRRRRRVRTPWSHTCNKTQAQRTSVLRETIFKYKILIFTFLHQTLVQCLLPVYSNCNSNSVYIIQSCWSKLPTLQNCIYIFFNTSKFSHV